MQLVAGLIQTFFDRVWRDGDTSFIDELIAPDCLIHGLHIEHGTASFKAFHKAFSAAFEDIRVTVDEEIIDGDRASMRCTVRMRQRATGKAVTFMGGGMHRFKDGRIVEAYNMWDFLGMLGQVGAVRADALAAALAPPQR